jgi:hypothetical protein
VNSGEMPPVSPSGASPDSQRVSVPTGGDQRRRRRQAARPRRLPPGSALPAGGVSDEASAPTKGAADGADHGSTVDVCV